MKSLRRLRLPIAFALAWTLMACASAPRTETSVFDTLARANQVRPIGCDSRFEIRSCHSRTNQRDDRDCTCIPREALRELLPY